MFADSNKGAIKKAWYFLFSAGKKKLHVDEFLCEVESLLKFESVKGNVVGLYKQEKKKRDGHREI